MAEEPEVNEGTPAPLNEFERAYHLAPRESMTREMALDEIAGVNHAGETGEDHPYWSPTSRLGAQAVDRMSALFKITAPGPRIASDQISKAMSLKAMGVTKEKLEKMPDAQDLVREEEIDDITGQLKQAWGEEKYEQNFTLMQKVVKEFTSEEQRAFLDRSDPELRPLGNSKEFLILVSRLGQMIEQQQRRFQEIDERRAIEKRFKKG